MELQGVHPREIVRDALARVGAIKQFPCHDGRQAEIFAPMVLQNISLDFILRQCLINVHEAKTQLSRLLERAHRGEEVVLSKAGKPYAKLVPLDKPLRKLGFMKGHVDDAFFDPLPEAELDA